LYCFKEISNDRTEPMMFFSFVTDNVIISSWWYFIGGKLFHRSLFSCIRSRVERFHFRQSSWFDSMMCYFI
jgi:hypothetical protein